MGWNGTYVGSGSSGSVDAAHSREQARAFSKQPSPSLTHLNFQGQANSGQGNSASLPLPGLHVRDARGYRVASHRNC